MAQQVDRQVAQHLGHPVRISMSQRQIIRELSREVHLLCLGGQREVVHRMANDLGQAVGRTSKSSCPASARASSRRSSTRRLNRRVQSYKGASNSPGWKGLGHVIIGA